MTESQKLRWRKQKMKSAKEQQEFDELKRTLTLKAELANDNSTGLRHRLTKEMVDLTEEYVNMYSDESNLDGYFSAQELRTIADKMDELKTMELMESQEDC